MKRDASSPSAYLDAVDGIQKQILESIRDVIFEIAPDVEEGVEYGMLDYPGLANLAAQKNHVALYVAPAVLAEHEERFPGVSCGKSCLRFTRTEQADPKALRALLRDVRAFRRKNAD